MPSLEVEGFFVDAWVREHERLAHVAIRRNTPLTAPWVDCWTNRASHGSVWMFPELVPEPGVSSQILGSLKASR